MELLAKHAEAQGELSGDGAGWVAPNARKGGLRVCVCVCVSWWGG